MAHHKAKDLQVPCIVCGEYVTWDDSPMPAACGTHTYQEVFEAYDAAQQGAQADLPETWAENEHPSACIHRKACIFYKPASR